MLGFVDDDTLLFFNYRSDRMREIVESFGFEEKKFQPKRVPKNIVSLLIHISIIFAGYCEFQAIDPLFCFLLVGNHHFHPVQGRVSLPGPLPPSVNGERLVGMAGKAQGPSIPRCW